MWKPLGSVAAAVLASGCSASQLELLRSVGAAGEKAAEHVQKIEDATLGNAAKVLPVYCRAPHGARMALRDRFNARLEAQGHKLHVHCAQDPTPLGN